jgi:hypothetical protein
VILVSLKVDLKYEENFKQYLCSKFDNQRVISHCISRCKRVQKYEGDLAQHFISDEGKILLGRLAYSREDANQGKQPKHSIEFQSFREQRDLRLFMKVQNLWRVQ